MAYVRTIPGRLGRAASPRVGKLELNLGREGGAVPMRLNVPHRALHGVASRRRRLAIANAAIHRRGPLFTPFRGGETPVGSWMDRNLFRDTDAGPKHNS